MATQKNFSVSDIESKLAGVKGQIDKHSKADEKSHSTSITYANRASSDSLDSGKIFDSTPVRIRKSFASNFGISTQDILKHNINKKSHEIILESGKIKIEEHEKLIERRDNRQTEIPIATQPYLSTVSDEAVQETRNTFDEPHPKDIDFNLVKN